MDSGRIAIVVRLTAAGMRSRGGLVIAVRVAAALVPRNPYAALGVLRAGVVK